MLKFRTIVLVLIALLVPIAVHGQETGDRGITMGYPASVGMLWHVSDRLALRPEFTFTTNTSEAEALGIDVTASESTSVGAGISILYYLRHREGLRTYLSPRFTYSRAKTSVESAAVFGLITDLTISSYSGSALFGAQYSLHRRFSVFAEVGFGFSDQTSSSSTGSGARTESFGWGTRTGIGAAFYF